MACAALLARRRDWAPSRQPRTRMAAGVPAGRCGRFGVAGIALTDRNAAIPIRRALSSRVSPDRRTGCSARERVDRSGPRRGGGSIFRLAGMDCGHGVGGGVRGSSQERPAERLIAVRRGDVVGRRQC